MSAIKPYLERQEDDHCTVLGDDTDGLSGLAGGKKKAAAAVCEVLTPEQVLVKDHTALMHTVWLRQATEEALAGQSFTVQQGKADGKEKRNVYIVLDHPVGSGPPWSPAATPAARNFRLLSWTSKMNCPSFSLPAGAPALGGTCPGAIGGQSVVPEAQLLKGHRLVEPLIGRPVDLTSTICNKCYATGGQYSTSGVQFAQILRYVWVRQALQQKNPVTGRSLFVDTMVAAIQGVDFKLDGGLPDPEDEEKLRLLPEPGRRRFFRIHDSGDFFSKPYLAAWKEVADALPDITFWAPSRIWAIGVNWVNEINNPPRNLIIRPSAYHVGEHPPRNLGPGWAAGSSVIKADENRGMVPERESMVAQVEGHANQRAPGGPDDRFTWDCRAYAADTKHTCRRAVNDRGEVGCRVCWLRPDEVVNYTEH